MHCIPLVNDPEIQCTSNQECPNEQACVRTACIDPCKIRGVCGENAGMGIERVSEYFTPVTRFTTRFTLFQLTMQIKYSRD